MHLELTVYHFWFAISERSSLLSSVEASLVAWFSTLFNSRYVCVADKTHLKTFPSINGLYVGFGITIYNRRLLPCTAEPASGLFSRSIALAHHLYHPL